MGWWLVLAAAATLNVAVVAALSEARDAGLSVEGATEAVEQRGATTRLVIPRVDRTRARQAQCREAELGYGLIDPCS